MESIRWHAASISTPTLRRIGYDGPRTATLATLEAIHRLHPQAIAFENLDPLLGRPMRLDLAALEQKLVHDGRGGYCFEQNGLLLGALEALGFRVTGLAARVLWNVPEGTTLGRTHMLLRIDGLDGGPHLADVGFGGQTLTGPLRLIPGTAQATPHEPFRLAQDGDGYVMEAQLGSTWTPLYRFDLQAQAAADYELGNWYVSTHPASHFRHNLSAARTFAEGRRGLRRNELATHYLGGPTERRRLDSVAELRSTLEDVFGLELPADSGLDATLAGQLTPAAGS